MYINPNQVLLFLSKFLIFAIALSVSLTPSLLQATTPPSLTLEQQVLALRAEVARLQARVDTKAGKSLPPLSDRAIEQIIAGSISWMIRAQEKSGHFRYEYAPYEDRYLDDDNIVRQAGALYQLGEALRREKGDTEAIEKAMVRATGYFERLSKEGTYNGTTFRCITENTDSTVCKLGATSLALIGVLSLAEQDETYAREYKDLIASYTAYIQAMKKKNEGFRNFFYIESGQNQLPDESSFSNGEALLALVRYYEYDFDPDVKDLIDTAFSYIKTSIPFDSALYLWVMAALVDMYRWEARPEYEAYVTAYTDWRVGGFVGRRGTENNMCAYTEGVALAYDVLEEFLPASALSPYREEIAFWLAKGSALQVGKKDQYRATVTSDVLSFSHIKNQALAYGGFLTSASVVTERIDFTQHCLNAYLVGSAFGE